MGHLRNDSHTIMLTFLRVTRIKDDVPCNSFVHLEACTTSSTSSDELSAVLPRCPHLQRPVLSVDLRITPEVNNVDVEKEQSIWVAVEISAEIDGVFEEDPVLRLDVVVIIDNSAYASDDCLESACRSALQIAQLLHQPDDRIAIFCTSYQHPDNDTVTGCQLYSLKTPQLCAIEEELQLAKDLRSLSAPQDLDFSETLAAAFRVLTQRLVHSPGTHSCGHVIILSPNPAECCGVFDTIAPVPIHVIIPGTVPWKWKQARNKGWQMSASCLHKPIVSRRDDLKKLISHARTHTEPGRISDVSIDIRPSVGCLISKKFGPRSYSNLQPGQVVCMVLKVDVPVWHVPWKTGKALNGQMKIDNLFAELEGMLGDAQSELFTVAVDYRHSIFPHDTLLTTQQTCRVARSNPSLKRSLSAVPQSKSFSTTPACEVYNQLVFCISSVLPPDNALAAFRLMFSKLQYDSELTVSLRLAKNELEYQTNTINKFKISIPPDANDIRIATSNLHMENEPPIRQTHTNPSIPRSSSLGSSVTVIHHEIDTDMGKDTARTIWQVMRRDSKSKKALMNKSVDSLDRTEFSNDQFTHIRRQALLNKRSIGADTLRSLSLGAGPRGEGGHAPWL